MSRFRILVLGTAMVWASCSTIDISTTSSDEAAQSSWARIGDAIPDTEGLGASSTSDTSASAPDASTAPETIHGSTDTEPGDEVITSTHEHVGNTVSWLA